MKKIILMFVVLITSIANAQDFNFSCSSAAEGTLQYELDNIFASSTAPSDDINDYPGIKNNTFNIGNVDAKKARVAALDGDGYSTQFHQPTSGTHYFSDNQGNEFAMDVYDSDTVNAGSLTRLLGDDWSRLYLDMVIAKWYFLHPNVVNPAVLRAERIADLDGLSNDNVTVQVAADAGGTIVFKKGNIDPSGIFDFYVSSYGNGNEYIEDLSTDEYANFKADIIAKRNEIDPDYISLQDFEDELTAIYAAVGPPTELGPAVLYFAETTHNGNGADRIDFFLELDDESPSRISQITTPGASTYVLLDGNSDIEANRIYSPNKEQIATFQLNEYTGFAFNIVEGLWHADHPDYVAHNYQQELREILDNSNNKPTSLPQHLTAAADGTPGTHNTGSTYGNRQQLLSGFSHGSVTVNFNGGNPSSANTTDGTITHVTEIGNFQGSAFTANLGFIQQTEFRNYTLDVIQNMWRLLHVTADDERGRIINEDFDIDGSLNVRIETFINGNKDWWIYFNDVAVISGGADFEVDDKNYNNQYTSNIHYDNMNETVYQRLLVFIQYMIDNQTRLKNITGGGARETEIITNLAVEFGVTVATTNNGSERHFTFTKNNVSSQLVQSNWTHVSGTSLQQLSPDNWVKFYAKCRGILIGLE